MNKNILTILLLLLALATAAFIWLFSSARTEDETAFARQQRVQAQSAKPSDSRKSFRLPEETLLATVKNKTQSANAPFPAIIDIAQNRPFAPDAKTAVIWEINPIASKLCQVEPLYNSDPNWYGRPACFLVCYLDGKTSLITMQNNQVRRRTDYAIDQIPTLSAEFDRQGWQTQRVDFTPQGAAYRALYYTNGPAPITEENIQDGKITLSKNFIIPSVRQPTPTPLPVVRMSATEGSLISSKPFSSKHHPQEGGYSLPEERNKDRVLQVWRPQENGTYTDVYVLDLYERNWSHFPELKTTADKKGTWHSSEEGVLLDDATEEILATFPKGPDRQHYCDIYPQACPPDILYRSLSLIELKERNLKDLSAVLTEEEMQFLRNISAQTTKKQGEAGYSGFENIAYMLAEMTFLSEISSNAQEEVFKHPTPANKKKLEEIELVLGKITNRLEDNNRLSQKESGAPEPEPEIIPFGETLSAE